jgi:hypothetical protein
MYTEEPLGHLMEFNSPVAATESVKGPDRFDERPGTWSLSSVAIVSLNALETSQWLAEILYPGPESTRQGPSEGVFYEDSPDRRSIRILTPSSKSGSFFNPTLVDHFGVTVRDLKMVAANLDDMNVPYSTIDSSLYVHDPAMNLIEVLSREE